MRGVRVKNLVIHFEKVNFIYTRYNENIVFCAPIAAEPQNICRKKMN